MQVNKELKNILDNHRKLISMISDNALPIKSLLLKDIQDMSTVIEFASHKKEGKNSVRT
jgi:hypothetical protein